MNTHADKAHDNESKTTANGLVQLQGNGQGTFQFKDNRPKAITQRKLQEAAEKSPQVRQFKTFQYMADGKQHLPARQSALAPPATANGGGIVQRVVTNAMLDARLAADNTYNGTIDDATPWHEAILVGRDWVGAGSITKPYGPPFGYQAVSADGTKQFRPPMVKKQSKMAGLAQANYEWRPGSGGGFRFNAHATVPDIDDYH